MSVNKCTKNHQKSYHILHCSWDMAHDRSNCYFLISGYFLAFAIVEKEIFSFIVDWTTFQGTFLYSYGRFHEEKYWENKGTKVRSF